MHRAHSLLVLTLLTAPHITWSSDSNDGWLTINSHEKPAITDMYKMLPQATKNELFKQSLNKFVKQGLSEPQDDCTRILNWICSLCYSTNDHSQELRKLLTNMSHFVQIGADPNTASDDGQVTMIQIVSGLGEVGGVEFLLKYGADPLLCDKFGHDAFAYAARHLQDKKPEHYNIVINLLKDHKS